MQKVVSAVRYHRTSYMVATIDILSQDITVKLRRLNNRTHNVYLKLYD